MALAIALIVILAGCGKKEAAATEESEGPTPVTVEAAVLGAIDRVIQADAVLYPVNQANVTSKISAPVKRVLVNRGDHVKAGQLLAELESATWRLRPARASINTSNPRRPIRLLTGATVHEDQTKAQADVQAAQQTYDAAKKVYENRVELQKEGALAQKLVDDAKVAMVQAQSQLEIARRHLAGAEPGEPARNRSRGAAGADECGESPLR